MIEKRIKYDMQGGVRNYLGKQKTIKDVPIKWKSNPKAPKTELAYITKAEKDLLIKKDLHGSLKKGANTGPSGIMSLDSQGDYTADRSPGSNSATSNNSDNDTGPKDYGYTGPGSTGSVGGFNEYDIEEGTIDDEDIENNKAQLSKMDMVKAGLSGVFLGPIAGGSSLYRSQKKAEKEMRDKIDADIAADIAASDYKYGISDARLTAGGATQETMDSYSDNQGGYAGASTEDYGGGEKDGGFIDGTNRRPFNSGGRIGYFFGGRVSFKNGGLASIL